PACELVLYLAMSAGLFSTHHQQTHDFKNPSLPQLAVAGTADHCSNGASPMPPPFISRTSPSANYNINPPDSSFHSFNLRYNAALQGFPLNGASTASTFRSFNGDPEQPVSTLGPCTQASLGGFLNLHQSSPASSETAFNLSSHRHSATTCTSSSQENKKFTDSSSAVANRAYVQVVPDQEKQTTALFSKELEAASSSKQKTDHIQAAHELLRDHSSNNDFTEYFESLQAKAAAAGVPDPLPADASYMSDLQASISSQGGSSLERFLPSNDEEEADPFAEVELHLEGALFGTDEFRMYEFKVRLCMRERSHDWTQCPFAHPGEKARRRDPRLYHYSAVPCPDFRKAACRRGDACELSHGVFECWLHPTRYRTQICKDGKLCKRKVCFFAHSPSQFRAMSSSSSSAQKQDTPTSMQPAQIYAQNMALPQSFDGLSLRLLRQHLPSYYQALLKQELNSSQIPDPHLNLPTIMPTLINHPQCQHQYYGGMDSATSTLPISFNNSPLRMAMAYGLPINVDAATLGNVNSSCQSLSGPRSRNLPSRFDSFNGSSILLQDAAPAASGFLCCKGPPPATNYVNVDDLVSMHSHYGRANLSAPTELQTDGHQMRALQAASLDGATRQMILNGEAVNDGFIPVSKLSALSNVMHNSGHQSIGTLPSSNLRPLMASPNWNSLSSSPLPRFMPAPSLDAVSQAQAVLTAHALAQQQAPSSPVMSPHTRHHLDILNNGTQAPTMPDHVIPFKNVDSCNIEDQHLQTASGRGSDSPQAISQLLASIQQLELRCATAEMKNNLMMVQAAQQQAGTHANSSCPSKGKSNAHQLETWGGQRHESGAGSCHMVDGGGSVKGAGAVMCRASVQQAGSASYMANTLDHEGSFDHLGWVDELI
ncbi:hypothetical protein GOP47_0007816, partial [Adiantum capillus-veneris]